MAVKISQLPLGAAVVGPELIPVDQSGVTVTVTPTALSQYQLTPLIGLSDSGTANNYVVTAVPTMPNLQVGQLCCFTPANPNTGASTLNLNTYGVKNMANSLGLPLTGGELTGPTWVQWNGTVWIVLGIPQASGQARTPREVAAGVIPKNYNFTEGNVLRYGAKGDGVTNDTAAFNTAHAVAMALPQHGFIYIPANVYLIASPGLTWTDQLDIRIFGDGPQQSVLIGDATNAYTILTITADTGHGTTGLNLNLSNFGIKNTNPSSQAGLFLADYAFFTLENILVFSSANAVTMKGMANGVVINPNFLSWNTNAASNTSLAMGTDTLGIACGPIVFHGGSVNGQGNVTAGGAVASALSFGIVFHSTMFIAFGPAVQSVCDFANGDDITLISCYSEGSCNTGANTATLFECGRVAACANINIIGGHYFSGNGTQFLANAVHAANLGNLNVSGVTFANMNAGALSYSTSAGTQVSVFNTKAPGGANRVFASGVSGAPTTQNVPYYVFPANSTGYGAPTGATVINNYPGGSATLLQTSQTVAEILTILQAYGLIGA